MSAIATLTRDAEMLAALNNAEVIDRACRTASISCPNCRFPGHCEYFRDLLRDYTQFRIKIHRARRAYNRRLSNAWGDGSWGACGYGTRSEMAFARDHENRLYVEAMGIRRWMTKWWPCADCIQRYNPTGRVNHPPFNAPRAKDLLEL